MRYNQLGHSGLFVSELCLGTMTWGGKDMWEVIGALDVNAAKRQLDMALDAGVNFVDTANIYAFGESEIILGKALAERRHDIILATKVRSRMSPNPNDVGLSRHHIMASVEASLKRLGTDHIDLLQCHSFDPVTPLEETISALDSLVKQGKVRYVGVSNFMAWQVTKALGIQKATQADPFVSLQAYYSLAGRDLEREIIPMLNDTKMGLLVWSPLAGGFLSGKFTRDNDKTEGRRARFDFPPVNKEKAYDIIDVAQGIAAEKSTGVAQICLAWLLHQKAVTSVIIGARTDAQLESNLKAVDIKLSESELARLNEASKLPLEYPAWFWSTGTDRYPGTQRDWKVKPKD